MQCISTDEKYYTTQSLHQNYRKVTIAQIGIKFFSDFVFLHI